MFIADGARYPDPYESGIPEGVDAVAVGWLDPSHAYASGRTDEAFVSHLFEACAKHATARTRGWHRCYFCAQAGETAHPVVVTRGGESLTLGDAEIRVVAEDGRWFVTPTLVLHYVVEHGYRPPDAFVQAVKRGVFAEALH